MKWFWQGTRLDHALLITFVVFVFCCGIGIGLFSGLDSQEAKVEKLEEMNEVLVQNLREQEIVNIILSIRLETLVDLMKDFVNEREKQRDYNEGAVRPENEFKDNT